jgi:ATP-dependent Clp protease protease subunit
MTDEDLKYEFEKLSKTLDISKMRFPDVNEYDQWLLYEKRTLLIDECIEEWDYHIVKDIININIEDAGIPKEERKPIILLINSSGGFLHITYSIIDIIKASTTPVWTVNMGEALSGGCLIFLMGERRFAADNSWAMCHAGSGGLQGNYSETKEQSKVWDEQVKSMGNLILERTGMDKRVYNKNKDKDWWLNQEQQLRYGFATDKLANIDEIWGA